jgi:hypothetical protein
MTDKYKLKKVEWGPLKGNRTRGHLGGLEALGAPSQPTEIVIGRLGDKEAWVIKSGDEWMFRYDDAWGTPHYACFTCLDASMAVAEEYLCDLAKQYLEPVDD